MRLCLTHYSGTLRNLCQSSEAIRVTELSIFIHLTVLWKEDPWHRLVTHPSVLRASSGT